MTIQQEAKSYFESIWKEEMQKLIEVGFTEQQAEVLLELMQAKAVTGGLF